MEYVFLKESAAKEDLFDNRPHQRVAKALAEVIRKSEAGMTIGLEGEWGSGKSTAIKLLQQELGDEADPRWSGIIKASFQGLRELLLANIKLIEAVDKENEAGLSMN